MHSCFETSDKVYEPELQNFWHPLLYTLLPAQTPPRLPKLILSILGHLQNMATPSTYAAVAAYTGCTHTHI
jgi:hypothetical protein